MYKNFAGKTGVRTRAEKCRPQERGTKKMGYMKYLKLMNRMNAVTQVPQPPVPQFEKYCKLFVTDEEYDIMMGMKLRGNTEAELRALYTEIMATEKTLETDLGAIMADLKETAARPGAFVCEYGFFREAYRLEVRRAVRSGACVHLCLITVSLPDGSVPPLKVLSSTMEQLQDVLVRSLRRGDVVSKFSGAQFVVMLPAANFEDSNMVMDRVVNAFYQQHRRNFLKLTVRVRELELG